jgi:hypothetical protein
VPELLGLRVSPGDHRHANSPDHPETGIIGAGPFPALRPGLPFRPPDLPVSHARMMVVGATKMTVVSPRMGRRLNCLVSAKYDPPTEQLLFLPVRVEHDVRGRLSRAGAHT